MHKLIRNIGQMDVTGDVGYITRRSSINELAEQLDFNLSHNKVGLINPGNLVLLFNDNKEIYQGVVISDNAQGKNSIEYHAMDYAFYLNKNEDIYQFNTTASDAIRTICQGYGIPIGYIVSIPTKIKKILSGTLSDIIKEILELAEKDQGIKYTMEMIANKFYIEKKIDKVIKLTTNLFGTNLDITKFIANPSRTRSIENMKNSIQIIQSGEESFKVITTARDYSLIERYGWLQQNYEIDEKDIAKAKNIANNMLKDLGKIFEDTSFELPGHDDARAGRILELSESFTGMSGRYLIKDCTHNIANGIHKMQLGLELI
ncbi:hypothetical protein [Clostridium sp.]|uniref:XkdQ/YqbQ family protein n=1 Tax=Clostridium sp. TaxID=1506 RepID=UPI002FC6E577